MTAVRERTVRAIQTALTISLLALIHFVIQAHLFLSRLLLKVPGTEIADPAFESMGEHAECLLNIVGFPLMQLIDFIPASRIPYVEWLWLVLNSFLWGGSIYLFLQNFQKETQRRAVFMGNIELNRKWTIAVAVVLSMVAGSAFVRAFDSMLAHIFSPGLLNIVEAATINTLEMGLMPIFVLVALGLILKLSVRQVLNLAWRTFLVGAVCGAIIGTTYHVGFQYATSGFIH